MISKPHLVLCRW